MNNQSRTSDCTLTSESSPTTNTNLLTSRVKKKTSSSDVLSSSLEKRQEFNPDDYMIIFEEVLKSSDALENFHQFLIDCHNQDPILFLQALKEYKKQYQSVNELLVSKRDTIEDETDCMLKIIELFKSLEKLIENFIIDMSSNELNLSKHVKQPTIDCYSSLQEKMDSISVCSEKQSPTSSDSLLDYLKKASPIRITSSLPVTCENPFLLLSIMDPNSLFKDIEFAVNMDLKTDQFPRYVRSQKLNSFLLKKGEDFTRSIGVNISSGYSMDIRYKPKDLVTPMLTDRDIYFAFTLMEDTPDWEALIMKPDVKSYISKTSYILGQDRMKGLRLLKFVLDVEFPVEDVWAVYTDEKLTSKIDTMAGEPEFIGFISPFPESAKISYDPATPLNKDSLDNQSFDLDKPPLALQLGALYIDYKLPIVKKRDWPIVMTSLYDFGLDCYINIGHTAHFESRSTPKDRVEICGMSFFMFQRIGNSSTRITHIAYTNLEVAMNSIFVIKQLWKKRTKLLAKGYTNVLKEVTNNGTKRIDHSTIKDHLNNFKSVKENSDMYPNRSWYKEYEFKKKK